MTMIRQDFNLEVMINSIEQKGAARMRVPSKSVEMSISVFLDYNAAATHLVPAQICFMLPRKVSFIAVNLVF